jgi:cyanate lyase
MPRPPQTPLAKTRLDKETISQERVARSVIAHPGYLAIAKSTRAISTNPWSSLMITDRSEVTNTIRAAKVQKNISWAEVAGAIGQSKEWTTAGCLGQMTFNKEQAEKIGAIFGLADEAVAWLQIAPYKGSLPAAVPADPLIYRWYEIVAVYGTTIKELIHEEFGDGIMSAIDLSMNISREADPKGDRVKVIMSGKFLPYKAY